MRRLALVVLMLVAIIAARAQVSAQLPDADLIAALQKGGYVLYMRHPKTNSDQADTDPLNLDNTAAQRHLSDEGRQQARAVGAALRALSIPVIRVISSRFYRAYETAKLLEVAEVTVSMDVSEGGLVVSPNENNRRAKALRQLLSTRPAPGQNTVIVAHKPNLVDAAGKDLGDIAEGEIAIFQPLAEGKFKLVARLTVEKWSQWRK